MTQEVSSSRRDKVVSDEKQNNLVGTSVVFLQKNPPPPPPAAPPANLPSTSLPSSFTLTLRKLFIYLFSFRGSPLLSLGLRKSWFEKSKLITRVGRYFQVDISSIYLLAHSQHLYIYIHTKYILPHIFRKAPTDITFFITEIMETFQDTKCKLSEDLMLSNVLTHARLLPWDSPDDRHR